MVITRTPYRISFFGGGTDYPAWCEKNGGIVISTSINKYSHVICRYLPRVFEYNYRIRYAQTEETFTVEEINHPSVRECLKFLNIQKGIEMVHAGDLPALSGLGSSSSFTVGLLHALNVLRGEMPTKRQLALDAIHVEQNLIKENVGSQDQVAAAFGGLNKIEFGGRQQIRVSPILMSKEKLDDLQDHLMLFFTGLTRNASEIAAEQIQNTKEKEKELKRMITLTEEAIQILAQGESLDNFGELLHESWQIKRGLSSKITNTQIDEIYDAARSAGALGGKLLGAGGGGFMLLFVKPELQPKIKERLSKLLYVPFKFESSGSQVIYCAAE